jgi:hypothetical protein
MGTSAVDFRLARRQSSAHDRWFATIGVTIAVKAEPHPSAIGVVTFWGCGVLTVSSPQTHKVIKIIIKRTQNPRTSEPHKVNVGHVGFWLLAHSSSCSGIFASGLYSN